MMTSHWNILEKTKNEYLKQVGHDPDFNKLNMYCVAHFSSVIEGASLTFRETWRLLDEGITPSRPEKHVSMVIDHFNALMYAFRLAFRKEKLTLQHLEKINSFINRRTGETGICPNTQTFYDTAEGQLRTYGAFTMMDDGSRKDYLHPHDVRDETKLLLKNIHQGLTNYSSFEKVNQ
ncbi:MAG: hypothetical protein OXE77_09505 [Flavobacteriaceae bacterium]|nr:hypothetical protein [Flavobacteriaceae bacterium]